jgi:hypothetical protein
MNLDDLSDVPPVVMLLYSEVYAKSEGWEHARKLLKGLLPELKTQSLAYDVMPFGSNEAALPHGEFDIHLDGALNVFQRSPAGCADPVCRVEAAQSIARSMGLVADRLWVTDLLTEKFWDFGRATNRKLDDVVADTIVLGQLMPLVEAGVLKFKSPWVPSCKSCLDQFDRQVATITDALVDAFQHEFEIEDRGDFCSDIYTGALFNPSVVLRVWPSDKRPDVAPDVDAYLRNVVRSAVRSALWTGREAAAHGGSIFSNSQAGLAGFAQAEGRFQGLDRFRLLDQSRSLNLPWVKDLSPQQVMELRQEADKALPQFRELMAKRLVFQVDQPSSGGDAMDFVAELRQQAAEVKSELEVINKHAKRFWKKPFTLLSLGAAAVGLATDQPVGAAGGLLALWQFLGTHDPGFEKDAEVLKCRPGYVLLKAQDLLAHARPVT